jgi:hypothetical protein
MRYMGIGQEQKCMEIKTIIRCNLTWRMAVGKHEDERFIDIYTKDKGYTDWVLRELH